MELRDDYALEGFLQGAISQTESRCHFCYQWRLRVTAQTAREHGFSHFSTTLLISPYQQHELIRQIGEQEAERSGVSFAYFDFRPLWSERGRLTKEYQLYRQQYCGCIYSEKERYATMPARKDHE